jgi:hypothetical protein
MSDIVNPQIFFDKLNEIKELYVEVKEAIILAENFDGDHDVYLSPLNELRNTLDHIMRCLIYPNKLDNEFNEAKEHLYRAGYDAYEVLAINVGSAIVHSIEKYDTEIITSIFPNYYTDVKPALLDVKAELADTRAHKKLNPETGTKSFTPYKDKIANLILQLRRCIEQIPHLQAEKRKKQTKNFWKILGGILIGVIITIAGTWVYDKYIKPEKLNNTIRENRILPDSSRQR